jgi:ABC-type antimicrobial peptide transport system permease subunit
MNQSMWQEHTMARLSSFFSVLALFLAGLGVYSVLNYSIQRRKKEIGLRLSLGASRSQVVTLILSDTMRWSLAGLIVGIPAGLAAMQSASALVYGIKPLDPWIICLTSAIIILCASIATVTPMIKIVNIDPARTLHSE